MACLPSTCPFCACGCGLLLQEENGRLAASFPSAAPPARSSLCIRGWHCTSPVWAPDRLTTPLVRGSAGLVAATWQEAVAEVASRLAAARVAPLVAVGPTVASEDAAAAQRLGQAAGARTCITDLSGAATARWAMGAVAPGARGLTDPEAIPGADLLWVIGFDAADAPQVEARMVDARRRGASIVRFDVHRVLAGGARVVTLAPGRFGELPLEASLIDEFQAAARPVVVVGARWLTLEGAGENTVALLRMLAGMGALERVVFAVGESNSWGVLDVLGPGAPSAETACRDEQLDAVVVVADDLVCRSPRPDSMADALSRLASLIVIDRFPTETTALADVVLPSCTFAEADGCVTNLFGQVHRWRRIVSPPGAAVPERTWIERIVEALGARLGQPPAALPPSRPAARQAGAAAARQRPAPPSTAEFPLSLLLASHPAAFSTGVLSSRDEVLRREAAESAVRVSPGLLKAEGLKPGWPVRVVAPGGEATVTVRADPGLPDGVVVLVPLPGTAAARLRGWYPGEGAPEVGVQPVPARLERP